jgi:hypothetical protein
VKTKLKVLAAAVMLSLGAGQANAAILDGSSGNGELFLSVWSASFNGGTSYSRDLGITMSDFMYNGATAPVNGAPLAFNPGATPATSSGNVNTAGYSLSFQSDSQLSSLLGQADAVWMVGALDSTGTGAGGRRFLSTSTSPISGMTNGRVSNMGTPGNSYVFAVNAFGTHASGTNGSAVNTAGDGNAYFGGIMGSNWGSSATFSAVGAVGQALQFFYMTPTGTNSALAANVQQYLNGNGASTWTLNADGSLVFAAAGGSSPVPLPAAVWLFGSGLLGLIGIGRRRQQIA